jgi:hypothetical protein
VYECIEIYMHVTNIYIYECYLSDIHLYIEDKIMAQLPNIRKTANETNIAHKKKFRRRMNSIEV